MKAIAIATLLLVGTTLSMISTASADQAVSVEKILDSWQGWCVRTDATCGPNGNAWVAVGVDEGNVEVCVTTNTGNILC